jgi:CDP-diacylglycerol--serine O-phosphatidyltransferase
MQKFRLIYLLPNLFTAGSIFLGMLSIIEASSGHFEKAAWFIVISMIFDGLDGRVARLTNTTSQFGVEFDSLADVVAFGVAPAMLVYFYIGHDYGKFGALVAALYVIFGAVRLARFNVTTGQNDPNVFIGLPIPTAAVFIVVWILMFLNYDLKGGYGLFLLLGMLVMSILKVSNIRYPSFKQTNMDRGSKTKILLSIITILSLAYLFPIEIITIIVTTYTLYGLFRATYYLMKKKLWK